jgi:photosystem II stability/assembly factor-like uncharacterized protein
MKKVLFAVILITSLFGQFALAYEVKWSRTNGPYGGWQTYSTVGPVITTYEAGQLRIYSITNGRGVARSFDGGGTWEMMSGDTSDTGLSSATTNCLAFSPESSLVIYAGTANKGFWVSTDKGDSWSKVSATGAFAINDVEPNSLDKNIVYFTANSSLVYKLFVATMTIEAFPTAQYSGYTFGVGTLKFNKADNTLYMDGRVGIPQLAWVFRITPEGTAWTTCEGTFHGLADDELLKMCYDPAVTAEIYAYCSGLKIKRGSKITWEGDTGTWANKRDYYSEFNPLNRNFLMAYLGTDGRIYKTTDHGVNWAQKNSGLPPKTNYGPLFYVNNIAESYGAPDSPPMVLRSSNGVYASFNGGETFQEINGQSYPSQISGRAFVNTSMKCVAVDDDGTVYAGGNTGSGVYDGHGLYKSSDGGNRWLRIHNGLIGTAINDLAICDKFYPLHNSIILAANPIGIFESIDNGSYWELTTNLDTNCLAVSPNKFIYAGSNGSGVYTAIYDVDGTEQWMPLPGTSLSDPDITALDVDPSESVYAGTNSGGVFRYVAGSGTWEVMDPPSGGVILSSVNALAVDEADGTPYYFAGTAASGSPPAGTAGLYRKIGTGAWEKMSFNGQYRTVYSIYIDKETLPHTIYVCTNNGVYANNIDCGASSNSWVLSGTVGRDYSSNVRDIARDKNSRVFYVADDYIGVSMGAPQLPVPLAPTGFRGSVESSSSIVWSWTINSTSEFGYHLVDDTTKTIIATLPRRTSREAETGLLPNRIYRRYAEAYNSYGASSSEVSSECTLANSPDLLRSVGRTPFSMTLNWDTNANAADETRYLIEMSCEASPVFTVCATLDADPPATVGGLLPNTPYWFRVSAENRDGIGTGYSNVISSETGFELLGPRISNMKINGLRVFNMDIIRPRSYITADLSDEATPPQVPTPIDKNTVAIRFGSNYLVRGSEIDSFYFATSEGVYKLEHLLKAPLGAGTYEFTVTASDEYGNPGSSDIMIVRVMAGVVQMIGPTLVSPVPFSPMRNSEEATISYTLSVDAPVSIYMYNLDGRVVLTRKFASGLMGGRAGYNSFNWDGRTDFGGIAGNGIYVYKIVSKGKLVGTGKLVVYD